MNYYNYNNKQIRSVVILTQTHLDHYQRAVMLPVGLSYILYSRLGTCKFPISVLKYQRDKGQRTKKVVGTNIKKKGAGYNLPAESCN
jgi:hypothetical protein